MTLDSFDHLPDSENGVADLLVLGDLSGIFDLRDMTLSSAVAGWSSQQRKEITLEQYAFLSEMTISEVADMIGLYSYEVSDIPIVEKAFTTFLKHPVLSSERQITLSQFIERYPEIGSIKLGFLDLSDYPHTAIPALLSTPITAIPGWQTLQVSSIVGLRELPIHQDIHLDGEIVTLSTVRSEDRLEIQLSKGSDSAIWPEDVEDGLQPFHTFFLQPEIAGESIRVQAYFKSCFANPADCQFIGPFNYREYKKGDSFYVSGDDWVAIQSEDNSIEFKRVPVAQEPVEVTDSFFHERITLKVIGIALILIVGVGTSALLWLLSKRKKVNT